MLPKRLPWARQSHSFLYWLVAVQLLALVPLMGFARWAVQKLGRSNQANAVAELERRVGVAEDAVAREADRVKTRVQILATQPATTTSALQRVRDQVSQLLAIDSSISSVSAFDRDRHLAFTVDRMVGAFRAHPQGPPNVADVLDDDAIRVSGLITEDGTDAPLINITTRWRATGSDALHTLQISMKSAEFGRVLREQRWPASWTAALLDQDMLIVSRSRDEALHVGKPATDSLQGLIRGGIKGVSYSHTKDGVEVVTAIAPVRGTSWWVVAGLPRQALAEEVSAPFTNFVIGGTALTLLGLAASGLLARYLDRQIKQATTGGYAPSAVTEFSALGAKQLMLHNDLVGMVRLVDRRSTWHNPALERIFGYAPGELVGHSPRQMHVDDTSFTSFGVKAYAAISTGQRYRDRLQMVKKDGSLVWVDVSGVGLPDESTLWMLLDVTAAQLEHERVAALAFRDSLTGLPNRALFEDRFRISLAAARRTQALLAVAMIDLNGFKSVNDRLGHAMGDELLRVVAARLQACVRANDTVARLGGDEFVVLLAPLSSRNEADAVVVRIREAVVEPVVSGDFSCQVSAAVGVAYCPDDATDGLDLLAIADKRMYSDKHSKRDSV